MNRILSRRIFREFRAGALKYTSLALMTAMALFMVISTVTVAEMIILGVKDYSEKSRLEDGQFVLFTEMTKHDRVEIEKMGVTLEDTSYIDYELPDNTTLRLFRVRKKMNLILVEEGRIPSLQSGEREVLVEKIYARYHGIQIGNKLEIGGSTYTVVGIGATSDYDSPMRNLTDFSADSKIFGTAFTNQELDALKIKEYRYSYRLNGKVTENDLKKALLKIKISPEEVKDPFFQAYFQRLTEKKRNLEEGKQEFSTVMEKIVSLLEKVSVPTGSAPTENAQIGGHSETVLNLKNKVDEFESHFTELISDLDTDNIDNLILFLPKEDNPRIEASAEDTKIDRAIGMFAGVVVMILFTYIISIFVVHSIDADSAVIGTLYALGVTKRSIILHYLTLPVVITLLGGVIGTILGMSPIGIGFMSASKYTYFSIVTIPIQYPVYIILYGCGMPPLIAAMVNYMVIKRKLSCSAMKLMRKEQEENQHVDLELRCFGYLTAFQIRQVLKELRTSIGVVFGIFLSLLVLFIGVNCHILCENVRLKSKEDTKFQYMYLYKYPPATAPEGGEACLSKTLTKEIYGLTFNITLLGIDEDNPYFEANPTGNKSEVVISSALASKFRLREGDELVLRDKQDDMLYAFDITSVAKYSTGFYVFMDIGAMRELLGKPEDIFNVVFSEKELDIPNGELYSKITKEDIDNASDIFSELMTSMVYSMIVASVIVFVMVMLLLMNVMLERSRYFISLFKVMGYRNAEIRKLYLNGNFFIIAIGTAIVLPIAKAIMDLSYPHLVANIASEVNLEMSIRSYILIYLAVIAVYFVIHMLLMRKLKKYTVSDVLKRNNQ